MTRYGIEKPEPAGKYVGKIYKDLRVFNEARTRLFTGLKNCKTAEAYQLYENAVNALAMVNKEFCERER